MNTSIPLMAISSFATSSANIATNHVLYKYPSSSSSSSSSSSMLSFNLSRNHKLQLFTKGPSSHSRMSLPIVKAEPNNEVNLIEWSLLGDLFSSLLCYFWEKVLRPAFASKVVLVIDDDFDSSATKTKSKVATTVSTEYQQPSSEDATEEESMSQFTTQVAGIVKLVDSREDIIELQLKHLDCEVTIRKKSGYTSSTTS